MPKKRSRFRHYKKEEEGIDGFPILTSSARGNLTLSTFNTQRRKGVVSDSLRTDEGGGVKKKRQQTPFCQKGGREYK